MTKRIGRLLGLIALTSSVSSAFADDRETWFRDQVAPILEKKCIHCHGESDPKGKLDLTSRAAALKGGDSGAAAVPGKPEESLILEMIAGEPPEMPQKAAPLSKEEVAAIRRWIEQGASWPDGLALQDRKFEGQAWWAFEPLRRPAAPAISAPGSSWARNPIDAFILATLQNKGLKPSPEADRRTLIRRLSFDLTGLPPTPEEVDAYERDTRPDAYERVVDRLLDSPHFGERWGRHWLDVVHYGDTHGYDKDKRRDNAWPYRDYVIRSLNEDVPYGRFVREQVAGDVLRPGDPRGVIATGFIAAGPWDFVGHVELRDGTVDKLKAQLNDRDDMLANTISTFSSMTVHCARCHDHKFDPIPQSDYYRLQAVFAGVDRGDRPYQSPELAKVRSELESKKDALRDENKKVYQAIAAQTSASSEVARLDAELAEARRPLSERPRPVSATASPTNGYHSGVHASPDTTLWVQVDLGTSVPIDEIRLYPARPTDFPDTPGFGFPPKFRVEVGDDPAFAASGVMAATVATDSRGDLANVEDEPFLIRPEGRKARYVRMTATRLWKRSNDYVLALGEIEVLSNGVNKARGGVVAAFDAIESGRWANTALVDGFDSRHGLPAADDPAALERNNQLIRVKELETAWKLATESASDPALRAKRDTLRDQIAGIDAEIAALPPNPLVYAVKSRKPRPIHKLRRGEVEQPAEIVEPGALGCIQIPGAPAVFTLDHPDVEGTRRAALAEWLTSRDNVLTWRSIANRIWYYHFGKGIVDTPNDFGRNGGRPTHPELLDWLAAEMLENGESLKGLHRLIVTSATYRQSSKSDPTAEAVDAENHFLWRQNRRRLDAESVRDTVLSVCGTLDLTMGGPGFDLFRFKDDHSPVYDHSDPEKVDNPEVRRRTVYRFTVRSVPNPFLDALDCADPSINTPIRSQTLTALQALALLNDLFMVRQSEAFADRLERLSTDSGSRIEAAYRLALGRPPRDSEGRALGDYAAKHGLPNACRLLVNTNEFMFID
jgi:hypothetical protein